MSPQPSVPRRSAWRFRCGGDSGCAHLFAGCQRHLAASRDVLMDGRDIGTVVLPNAVDGIVTGCILAVGRIVGESAALLFTAGFGLELNNFITSLQASSATLTVALYVYANERGETGVAFAIAAVLMLLVFLINFAATLAGKKLKRKAG